MENFSAGEGDITIFRWKLFFSQCRKNFVRGIIQCFRNSRAWKNFMQKGISLFSVELFCSHCQKISWEELINVSVLLRLGTFFCRGMRYHYFPLEVFFLTVPKKFREVNHSKFQINSGSKNFSAEEGYITFFCWKFFFPQCQKIS